MDTEYKEILTQPNDVPAVSFTVSTRRGSCTGIFLEGRIYVHFIHGKKCMKGLMDILINKFKTNKITFTPLINNFLQEKVKNGVVKICPADAPGNPYHEDFKYLEVEWGAL